jgi:ApaG protein
VVGVQPRLKPGETFEYTSWCVLATPSGEMRGTYQMVTDAGSTFDADIAPFRLALPQTLN